MPARRQLLQKIVVNANTSTLTLSNIPQTYTDLLIVISARTSRASDTDAASVRFNGDTGTNYLSRLLESSGTAAQSRAFASQTSLYIGQGMAGASATANTFGNAEAYIPNYTLSVQKAMFSRGNSENNATACWMSIDATLWSGTAAITSITLFPVTGPNWIAGSTFYLYGITQVPVILGGTETISGGYKYHTFSATSSMRVVEAGQVEYLIVSGGGGGGGWTYGGGGGGGGLLTGRAAVSQGNQTVTIGGGGAGSDSTSGSSGTSSTFVSVSPTGGGGGGGIGPTNGLAGGSGGGGGGGGGAASSQTNGGAGTAGQGNNGGGSYSESQRGAGGGGGGAGAVGGNAAQNLGGNGGAGLLVWGSVYAGGGGGATYNDFPSTPGNGGNGGGGVGGRNGVLPAGSGVANTGGGGGGRGTTIGNGGSGIVIIRYPYISN